jgi:hypothetical protein
VSGKQQDSQDPGQDPGQGQGDSTAPLAERVDSIETEQKRQGGLLDQILGKLGGEESAPVTQGDPPPAVAAADMAEQMKQAVRDVQAEQDAEVGRQQRLGRTRPEPETQPREVMIKGKQRLQRALFGGDPR